MDRRGMSTGAGGSRKLTPGQRRWLRMIEERATSRLHELQRRKLWDGRPPVPIDHIVEHLLELSITWDVIPEHPDEMILASLRPASRELVLNETHYLHFRDNPGRRAYTLAHECGHCDCFATLIDGAEQLRMEAGICYVPRTKSTLHGDVQVLGVQLAKRLADLPPEQRWRVVDRIRAAERASIEAGRDTDLERRTVDRYAAALLMPEDLVRQAARTVDVTRWEDIRGLGEMFGVSKTAMRIRLQEVGLLYQDVDGRLTRENPAHREQPSLFS